MAEHSRPSWDDLVQLITELDGSDFDNVAVEYDDISVRMSRGELPAEPVARQDPAPAAPAAPAPSLQPANPAPAPPETAAPAAPAAAPGVAVTSPMIGIFFRSPSPGAAPFVSVGDTVKADSVIGIIEVMKLMNPVHAGVAGTVSSIAAEDAQAVEFGEDLMYIVPEGS
jgi:acetyl-CoA carboxylase biotin carboxyl carrier protein